jgi:hypothetical protein
MAADQKSRETAAHSGRISPKTVAFAIGNKSLTSGAQIRPRSSGFAGGRPSLKYVAGNKAGFAGSRGLLMRLKRAAAAIVAVLAISLAVPGFGQSAPQAAPTGPDAQTQD